MSDEAQDKPSIVPCYICGLDITGIYDMHMTAHVLRGEAVRRTAATLVFADFEYGRGRDIVVEMGTDYVPSPLGYKIRDERLKGGTGNAH